MNLNALLGIPPGEAAGLSWQFRAGFPTYDATVTAGGLLRGPTCTGGVPAWPVTISVEAVRSGGGQVAYSTSINFDEALLGTNVICAIPEGEALCHNPAETLTVEAGKTVQFYSRVSATCSSYVEPPLPPGACTPDMTFCWG